MQYRPNLSVHIIGPSACRVQRGIVVIRLNIAVIIEAKLLDKSRFMTIIPQIIDVLNPHHFRSNHGETGPIAQLVRAHA